MNTSPFAGLLLGIAALCLGGCAEWRNHPGDGMPPIPAAGPLPTRVPRIAITTSLLVGYDMQAAMAVEQAFRKAGYEPHVRYESAELAAAAGSYTPQALTLVRARVAAQDPLPGRPDIEIDLHTGNDDAARILWAIISGITILAIPYYGPAVEDLPVQMKVRANKDGKVFAREYQGDISCLLWLPLLPVSFQPAFVVYPTVDGELKEDSRGEFSVVFRTTYQVIKDLRQQGFLER
jgi:hypothetical protein